MPHERGNAGRGVAGRGLQPRQLLGQQAAQLQEAVELGIAGRDRRRVGAYLLADLAHQAIKLPAQSRPVRSGSVLALASLSATLLITQHYHHANVMPNTHRTSWEECRMPD